MAKKKTKKKLEKGGILKDWYIDEYGSISGKVYNDKRWADGERIHTTPVLKMTVETRNTIYRIDPYKFSDIEKSISKLERETEGGKNA